MIKMVANKFSKENCALCRESHVDVGQKTEYGSRIIYKIGDCEENGWFATLSPRTGGDIERDFSIQLIPFAHLTNFSQIDSYPELAKNYGIAFSRIAVAVGKIMNSQGITSDSKRAVPIGTYGKCKHPDEHIHIKIFPWRGDIGQPFTTDSSFQRKDVYKEPETGEEFVKMKPVRKSYLSDEKFNELSNRFMSLLK